LIAEKIFQFNDIRRLISEVPEIKNGVVVDSNIIFAASYELDVFHDEVAEMLNVFSEFDVPLFTNVNIRTEFLELHRRVLIAESLIDFYEDFGSDMEPELQHQLKSHRTSYRKAVEEDRLFKLSDQRIKSFRNQLMEFTFNEQDAWQLFCQNYFSTRISGIWEKAVELFNLQFISMRQTDKSPQISGDLSWEQMENLVSQYGIGVSDAMILNLYLNSTFSAIITADSDLVYVLEKVGPKNKIVLIPNRF